eukprot:5590786-Prymnesium_polylepis.1
MLEPFFADVLSRADVVAELYAQVAGVGDALDIVVVLAGNEPTRVPRSGGLAHELRVSKHIIAVRVRLRLPNSRF